MTSLTAERAAASSTRFLLAAKAAARCTPPGLWSLGGRLVPAVDADLSLSRYERSGTLVTLAGVYRPPLGAVGAVLDRAGLRLVAEATVRAFVSHVAAAVADPVRTVAGQEAGVLVR